MVTKSHTYHYSMTTNEQDNPNLIVTRNHWSNMAKAVNGGTDFATSKYTRKGKKKYTYTVPHTLTAHDFRLEIPSNAYITRVRFEVRMRTDSKKIKVKAPNAYFMIYKGTGKVTQAKTGKTGWYDSTYRVYADAYLSTSWKTFTYTMEGKEWNKMKYPSTQLDNNIMGIDLHFNTPKSMSVTSAGVQLRWVRIIVDYEIPNYTLTYLGSSNSGGNPLMVKVGEEYCVKARFRNTTKANGGTQYINVQLPFGSVLKSFHSKVSANLTEYDAFNGVYLLECDGKGLADDTVTFCLQSNSYGLKTLDLTHNNVKYPYYVYPLTDNEDFGDLQIIPSTIEQNKTSCFKFSAKVRSTDTSIVFGVTVDGDELTDWSKVSSEVLDYYSNSNHGNNLVSWELEQSSQAEGVSINWNNTNNNQIAFNVPTNRDVNLAWTGCFVPLFDGANHIRVVNGDTSQTTSVAYNCLSTDGVAIDCKIDDTVWLDHRIVTQVTTDGYIIRCAVRDSDKVMVEGECTLKSYIWEDLAYIGCIPLPRSHYEPSHDFTNKILSESYKNKTYKGKEGVYEDDTDFKIRLPPKDWTTLQGLSKLDKPIPVNAVPTAFEGDVLNFRGWYEIGGIKDVTKTNPLYYDGQVDLDPLTHNINTRFSIEKGNASNPYGVTSALATLVESGDEFANRTYINEDGDIVSTSEGYFNIETDGVYIYDSELEENLRTIITLDNAQSIKMVSKDVLNEHTEIKLEWNSSKISENKENLIERIVYITDDTGKALFKYQYSDFEFDLDNDYYTCQVTGTVIHDGEEEVVIQKELIMAVDVESLDLVADADGNIVQESEPAVDEVTDGSDEEEGVYSFNDYVYGTTLTFSLNGNVLKVTDGGWNGRGIVSDNIELPLSNYKYELDFKNNNADVETTEILTFFDFEVSESVQSSDLTNFYGNMFVTSFPVVGKKILFTRQSQEGTIYYLADDGSNNFTYVQEPFYMYFCGVDLANHEGSSLFDLDNSYTTFYLQNGLVRLGFNRISGELYLSKYDVLAGEYINVSYLKATNLDFTVSSYSDDKITIKAGTTTYTMYRGHPYVIINHPDEDFEIFNTINRVYADRINDDAYDYPAFFDLTNKDNLLPTCVGGSNISISCLDVDTDYVEETVTVPSVVLTQLTNPSYTNDLTYFSITGAISSLTETVEGMQFNGIFGNYSANLVTDNSVPKTFVIGGNKSIVQNNESYVLSARLEDYDGNGCEGLGINFIQKNQHFYDKGITGDNNSAYWSFNTSTTTQSVGSTGTTVTNSDNLNRVYTLRKATSGTQYEVFSPLCSFEFDLISVTGNVQIQQRICTTQTGYTLSETGHYKIINDDEYINIYRNDVLKDRLENTMTGLHQIRFNLLGVGNFTYKNFKVLDDEIFDTATTDENGIAVCEVSGDGSGLDTYYAKSGNLKSNELTVIDGVLLDKGTVISHTDLFNNMESFTRMGDGTSVYYYNTGSITYQLPFSNYVYFNGKEYAIDIELLENNYARLQVARYKTGSSNQYDSKTISGTGKIHIELLDDGIFWYQNGELIHSSTTKTNDEKLTLFILTPVNQTSDFKYKNLVVYPIGSEEPTEEIFYENSAEVSKTNKNSSTIYDNNMSVQLPTNAEITFDVYSTNSTSGSEHRFFLLPKSQYSSGTTQPTEALFIDLLSGSKAQIGKRESNSTSYFVQNIDATSSTYHTVKIVKTGTSIAFYLDNTLLTTQTVSWIDNYSDYCLSMMRWSASGTSSIRNVTIKKV